MSTSPYAPAPLPGARADSGADAGALSMLVRRGQPTQAQEKKLRDMSHGFESVFVQSMLHEMLEPTQGEGIVGSGPGASVLQSLLEQNLADTLSKSGAFGIGKVLYESLRPTLAAERVAVRRDGRPASIDSTIALEPAAARATASIQEGERP